MVMMTKKGATPAKQKPATMVPAGNKKKYGLDKAVPKMKGGKRP